MSEAEDVEAGTAAEFWEPFYREAQRWVPGRVNPVMASIVEPLTAGRALDLGCGEGGDALWFARHGWDVTAVDVSGVALARAATHAEEAGVGERITWEQHDLEQTFPVGSFDLVSAQFLQSPIEFARERVLRSAARAVAPGGLLLVVAHAAAPSWARNLDHEHVFPTPNGDLAALDLPETGWRIDRVELVERDAVGPDGESGSLVDSVVAVTRLTEQER